jgi:hypothetical protein
MSPHEANRFFAACGRRTAYAATAKTSVPQRAVKTGYSYKTQQEKNRQGYKSVEQLANDRLVARGSWLRRRLVPGCYERQGDTRLHSESKATKDRREERQALLQATQLY